MSGRSVPDDRWPDLRERLDSYAQYRWPPGSFLVACLEHDLAMVYRTANEETLACLPQIIRYMFNDMPAISRGSRERVSAWLSRKDAGQ